MRSDEKKLYGNDRFLWSQEVIANYADSLHYGPGLDCIEQLCSKLGRRISLLDAGAASGAFHAILNNRKIAHDYTACDINRILLAKGKEHFSLSSAIQCDIAALPFKADSFDAVVCYGTIFNIEKWEKALAELLRVSISLTVVNFLAPPLGSNSLRPRGVLPGQYIWMLNMEEFRSCLERYKLPRPDMLLSWQVPLNRKTAYPTFRGLDYRLEFTGIWFGNQP